MSQQEVAWALLFWLSAFMLFYVYFGYGLLLAAMMRCSRSSPLEILSQATPSITVLVTAHNEEREIADRLRNLLAQTYPPNRFDVLVASDGSTDNTERIVDDFAVRGNIRLFRTPERVGKSAAQNAAIAQVQSEIVVLSDAATRFEPNFLAEIVKPFADPRVGCVTGVLRLVERRGAIARGQGYYWRYELKLRALESKLGILAVASGQAMAFRRSLFRQLPPHSGEDCVIPLDVVMAGSRVIHQPTALASDAMEHDPARELRSRIRMTMRNWTGTWLYPALLNPLRSPGFALALWSHKLLRWLGSVLILALTAAAFALIRLPLYGAAALLSAALYSLALAGWYSHRHARGWAVAESAFGFIVANLGFLLGLCRALGGQRILSYRSGHPGGGRI